MPLDGPRWAFRLYGEILTMTSAPPQHKSVKPLPPPWRENVTGTPPLAAGDETAHTEPSPDLSTDGYV